MSDQTALFYRKYANLKVIKSDFEFECPLKESAYVIVSDSTNEQQKKIDQLSAQISSSRDVEALLDRVNWRMFIYSSEQICSNFSYSEYEFQNHCSEPTDCFSDSIDDLFNFSLRCGNTSCTNVISAFTNYNWFICLILGIICLLGNMVVIYNKVNRLLKKQIIDKEIQIYYMLVLNLALADLLMGIYLAAIAFEIRHKANIGVYYSLPGICNTLGILNTTSTQVSLTMLFIISLYRLVSIIKPYKIQHFRFVTTLIIITWLIWLMVAILPILPLEPLQTIFTFGLVKNRQVDRDSMIDFGFLLSFFQTKILPSFFEVTEVQTVLNSIVEFPTRSVMKKFTTRMGWINSETAKKWNFVGFYDLRYMCSADFVVINEQHRHYNYLTLTLVFYNLILSIVILIFYILVSIKVYENDGSCFDQSKLCVCRKFLCYDAFFRKTNPVRSAENRRMFKRLSFIVLTDLMCWIPLCITSLVVWHFPSTIVQNWEELNARAFPFQITMLILVPFNSILNPYIYSCNMWKRLFAEINDKFFTSKISTNDEQMNVTTI